MREVIISDITRMNRSFCVIALESKQDRFASVRPVPWGGGGWLQFQFQRGDRLSFDFDSIPEITPPHIEDQRASHPRRLGKVSQGELVACLNRAEIGQSLQDMFGHFPHVGANRGAFVPAGFGSRSICGCPIARIRLQWQQARIGASLDLPFGASLNNLPLTDRDWWEFIEQLQRQFGSDRQFDLRLQRFFNSFVSRQIAASPIRFARIGLTRRWENAHWLMLDSLFPLPRPEWIAAF